MTNLKRIVVISSVTAMFCMACVAHKVSAPGRSESEQVFDRYLEVCGGRAQLEKVVDSTMEGTVMVMGMTMDFVDQRKAPNRTHARATVGGNTFFERVTNGEKGFRSIQGLRTDLSEAELAKGWRAEYWPELEYDKRGVKSVLAGTEEVDGKQAQKIELQYGEEDSSLTWFLVDSGLKIKGQFTQNGVVTTVTYGDYREVDGRMFPFSMVIENQMRIDIKAKNYQMNQNLEDALFKLE